MVNPVNNIGIVILAAGKGKRMNAHQNGPKVLVPLLGRPLISHLLENIKGSVVQTKPVVVIAPDLYVIRDTVGPVCEYAIQESQLGTGHAVLSAKDKLMKYDHILVLYGDHPLVTARTIDALVKVHLERNADITISTMRLPHFEDWFSVFDCYGRIKRDKGGNISKIVEKKDATEEEQTITEINSGYYLFKAQWLWSALPKLTRDNAQHEYYITDLISMALKENRLLEYTVLQDPREALGINTPPQLSIVEKVMQAQLDFEARGHTAPLPL